MVWTLQTPKRISKILIKKFNTGFQRFMFLFYLTFPFYKFSRRHFYIFLSHSNYKTGLAGCEKYIFNEINELKQHNIDSFHIFPMVHMNKYGVSIGNFTMHYIPLRLIKRFISKYSDSKLYNGVYIHHIIFINNNHIDELLNTFRGNVILFIHDLFLIDPEIYLKESRVDKAIFKIYSNVVLLKQNIEKLFTISKQIFVPSDYILKLAEEKKLLHIDKFSVFPLVKCNKIEKKEEKQFKLPIKIAFLGYKSENKGWDVFSKLISHKSLIDKYEFYHIGSNIIKTKDNFIPVSFSYLTQFDAAEKALLENKIDLVLLWSIVKESYSYTFQEAVAAGIPVLTSSSSGNISFEIQNSRKYGMIFKDENSIIKFLNKPDNVLKYLINSQPRFIKTIEHNSAIMYLILNNKI